MDKQLRIQNIHKIFGRHVRSKWLPKTEGWVVGSIELIGDTYCFELVSNGLIKQVEIQLRRESAKYDPIYKEFLYELWAWNLVNRKPEQMWCKVSQINTIEEMVLRLGMMLEKILPSK
jgi:hypothetical protein